MCKIVNMLTPPYLGDKLPPQTNPFAWAPRTSQEFRIRTKRFRDTFFPDAVNQWNVVISDFADMPELKAFKSHLLSFYRPAWKSTFGVHDPHGLKRLFQIRLGVSPLRHHKKNTTFWTHPMTYAYAKLVQRPPSISSWNALFTLPKGWFWHRMSYHYWLQIILHCSKTMSSYIFMATVNYPMMKIETSSCQLLILSRQVIDLIEHITFSVLPPAPTPLPKQSATNGNL